MKWGCLCFTQNHEKLTQKGETCCMWSGGKEGKILCWIESSTYMRPESKRVYMECKLTYYFLRYARNVRA